MSLPLRNPALREFWRTPARNRVLYGGRSSSKSWCAAAEAIFLASHCKIRVLCTRQFQNRIADSVYALLKIQIERFGLQSIYKITDNRIICTKTGSEFMFYGLWRSIDEIKSLESVDIHWAEEAHLLTEEQWNVINPTIRAANSQHWIIFNPRLSSDFVYKRFILNPPPDTITRLINYTDNPYLSDTIRAVIDNAKAEDYDAYSHIYLGVPRDNDDDSVIPYSWARSIVDAHKKLSMRVHGDTRCAFDVADGGVDLCALSVRQGILLHDVKEWTGKNSDLFASTKKVFEYCDNYNSRLLLYDGDGIGAGVKGDARILNERRKDKIETAVFRGSASVQRPDAKLYAQTKNRDFFANFKAQAWWTLRERIRKTHNAINGISIERIIHDDLISINGDMPNIDKLLSELSQPKVKYTSGGKILIDKQPVGTKSPNLADAVMMVYSGTGNKLKFEPLPDYNFQDK